MCGCRRAQHLNPLFEVPKLIYSKLIAIFNIISPKKISPASLGTKLLTISTYTLKNYPSSNLFIVPNVAFNSMFNIRTNITYISAYNAQGGGGVSQNALGRGVSAWGVSAQGGCLNRGVCSGGV